MAEVTEPSVTDRKERRPRHSDGRWVSHSIGCFQEEWREIQEVAALGGQSTNGFIRQALREWCRFERLNLADKAQGVE